MNNGSLPKEGTMELEDIIGRLLGIAHDFGDDFEGYKVHAQPLLKTLIEQEKRKARAALAEKCFAVAMDSKALGATKKDRYTAIVNVLKFELESESV